MNRRLSALCGALALLATLGCGNKGPLYLPQAAPDGATAQPSQDETRPKPEKEE